MSSSSEEDLSKFSEAADVKLFNNSLFAENKGERSTDVPVKPSLRYLDTPDENRTDLKVTPGFQKHVASQLMRILDSSLAQDPVGPERTSTPDQDSNGNCTSDLSSKKPEGGIKLFGASAAFIVSCNITPPPPTRRRKRGRKAACFSSESDSSSNEADISNLSNRDSPEKTRKLGIRDELDLSQRFAACAVSSDWILNGEATKGWALPHAIKDPIQGEATPDLIRLTSALACTSVKHKKKRKKEKKVVTFCEGVKTEDTQNLRRRGKRGKKSKKKDKATQADGESLICEAPKKKKKRRDLVEGLSGLEILCDDVLGEEIPEGKKGRKLYEKLKRSIYEELSIPKVEGLEETSKNIADVKECCKKKKKKKRSKTSKIANLDESVNQIIKKIKKKKHRKERENELPVPVFEDEGFDSDPTKEQRKLLKAQLKKQKKWQNKIEYLSKDLANLMMANVKED